jgi:hypothetical protein
VNHPGRGRENMSRLTRVLSHQEVSQLNIHEESMDSGKAAVEFHLYEEHILELKSI